MGPETRSKARSNTIYDNLEVEGEYSPQENAEKPTTPTTPDRPQAPSEEKTSPLKRKASGSLPNEGSRDGGQTPSPTKRRGRPSAEEPIGQKQDEEAEDSDNASDPDADEPDDGWPLCIMDPEATRFMFHQGQIIILPLPVPNTNPTLKRTDRDLYSTRLGGVYSKKRMAVVLYRFTKHMMVLPLYSWGGRGLASRPDSTYCDYAEICNERDRKDFNSIGIHRVLGAEMNTEPGLAKLGCVSLAGAVSVDYREDIEIVGELARNSRTAMQKLMRKFLIRAHNEM